MTPSPVLTPTDRGLQQSVIDELDWTPGVHPAAIGVAVADGVVTLAGEVASLPEKIAAEKAVLRVAGVRNDLACPGEQSGADTDQQFDQQRFLVGEVSIDRGPTDADRGADVLETYGEEPSLGHEPFGGGDQLVATV